MKIKDSQVLITGANRGIGLAFAEELAKRGAYIHIATRDLANFQDAENLKSLGAAGVKTHALDVGNLNELKTFVQNFCTQQIPDILINNAGQSTGGLLEEQDPQQILNMLNVNLTGLILLTREFLPFMLKEGRGKIVNNASVTGRMFFPAASTYSATKAGVIAFTESLKQELRGSGVSTLLLITPGVKTRMFDAIPKTYGKHMDLSMLSSIPASEWAGRMAEAIEKDLDIVEPKGFSKMGVRLATHWPHLFESIVGRKFNRSGQT